MSKNCIEKILVPLISLNNGKQIPQLGLGTWKSAPEKVKQSVKDAIDIGYRHFDCAYVYENENEVGEALQEKLADNAIKREDLFITSKLWTTFMRPDMVETGLCKSLKNLKLDYLDLYLMHWPTAYVPGDKLFPKTEKDIPAYDCVDITETWQAMEKLVQKGRTQSIGVSNFNTKQLARILNIAQIQPVINQIECHPYLAQHQLRSYCAEKQIHITAYSPLGSPDSANENQPKLMDEPQVKSLADKYQKSVAQILLRYHIQCGNITIPKSVTKSRLEENFHIFDFNIQDTDMAYLHNLDKQIRYVPFIDSANHPNYPFTNE